MPLDAQQTFYRHNKILFRFLLLATAVFIIIVTLVWWQDRNSDQDGSARRLTPQTFSSRLAMADSTRAYSYGAKILHDIEAYPEIKSRFLTKSLSPQSSEEVARALEETLTAAQSSTEDAVAYVRATSYYIGNLLILPQVTLHETLLSAGRPHTTELLQTALADVRSGVVKIQQFHDAAPPYLYSDALSPVVFYPAPSSPSLTVSEVAMVFYILAAIDPAHARVYERQLAEYASVVFSTGAHFRSDIEQAILLAETYYTIMRSEEAYADVFAQARKEWVVPAAVVTDEGYTPLPQFVFPIHNFPYQTDFFVNEVINNGYRLAYKNERPAGSLMLTLTDTRIPQARERLYQYTFTDDTVLPFALDLQPRHFPAIGEILKQASYVDADTFAFITKTGDTSSIVLRDGGVVTQIQFPDTKEDTFTGIDELEYNAALQKVIFVTPVENSSGKPEIITATLAGSVVTDLSREVRGNSPTLIDTRSFAYVDELSVKLFNEESQTSRDLVGIEAAPKSVQTREIQYFSEQGVLAVHDLAISTDTFVPSTKISLYELVTRGDGEVIAKLVYAATFIDVHVEQIALSPAGRYIALMAGDTLSNTSTDLLIFDIINGIITKEINLASFSSPVASLDGWVLF